MGRTRALTGPGGAEALLLVAVVAAPWPYGSTPDWARFGLAAWLLAALAVWSAGRALRRQPAPALALPALGLPLLAALQAASGLSVSIRHTLEAGLLLTALLGTMVFWSERARHRAPAYRLCGAVLLTCLAQAVFGATQWSTDASRIYGRATPTTTSPFGAFVNHNHFAGLAEMGALLALGLAAGRVRGGRMLTPARVGLAGVSLALAATHVASRSRGGLLALVAGLATLALLGGPPVRQVRDQDQDRQTRERLRRLLGPGLVGLAVLAFALAVVPADTRHHVLSLLSGKTDSSGSYRLDVARSTAMLALAHPVSGSGLGAFADAFPPFKTGHGDVRTAHAESDVLEFLAEGGLIGLFLAFLLGRVIVRRASSGWQTRGHPGRRGLQLGSVAAVAALGVHSLVDFNLRVPSNALIAASLLGLAAAGMSPEPADPTRRSPVLSSVTAVMLACLAVAGAWRALGGVALDKALEHARPQRRLAALDRVVARHPYLDQAHRARGRLWWELAGTTGALREARLARAERDLGRALALRPRWGEVWAEHGWVRLLRGDVAGAVESVNRGIALDPTHIGAGVTRGAVLVRAGSLDDALLQLTHTEGLNAQWSLKSALAIAVRWTTDVKAYQPLIGRDAERLALVQKALREARRPQGLAQK